MLPWCQAPGSPKRDAGFRSVPFQLKRQSRLRRRVNRSKSSWQSALTAGPDKNANCRTSTKSPWCGLPMVWLVTAQLWPRFPSNCPYWRRRRRSKRSEMAGAATLPRIFREPNPRKCWSFQPI